MAAAGRFWLAVLWPSSVASQINVLYDGGSGQTLTRNTGIVFHFNESICYYSGRGAWHTHGPKRAREGWGESEAVHVAEQLTHPDPHHT